MPGLNIIRMLNALGRTIVLSANIIRKALIVFHDVRLLECRMGQRGNKDGDNSECSSAYISERVFGVWTRMFSHDPCIAW